MDSVVVELASSGDRIRQRIGWVKWIVAGKCLVHTHMHTHARTHSHTYTHAHPHTHTFPLHTQLIHLPLIHLPTLPPTHSPSHTPLTYEGHGEGMEPPFTPPTPLTPPTPVTPVTYIPTGWERGGTSEYYVSMVTGAPAWEWGGRGMEEVSIASSATSDTSEVRVNSALKNILLFVGEEFR